MELGEDPAHLGVGEGEVVRFPRRPVGEGPALGGGQGAVVDQVVEARGEVGEVQVEAEPLLRGEAVGVKEAHPGERGLVEEALQLGEEGRGNAEALEAFGNEGHEPVGLGQAQVDLGEVGPEDRSLVGVQMGGGEELGRRLDLGL